MKRRAVIVSLGALAAGAGCVESSPPDDEDGAGEADGTPDNENKTGETPSPTPTDTPGEGDGAGRSFADIDCPSFADSVDRTVCSHTDTDSTVYPTVSQAVFTPTTDDDSVETMAVVVHNESDDPFGFNPYDWTLKRQTADGWDHVAPEEVIEPWYNLPAGKSYTWRVSVESQPELEDDQTTTVTQDLASGTYAFQMTGILEDADEESSSDDGTHIECIALFSVTRSD